MSTTVTSTERLPRFNFPLQWRIKRDRQVPVPGDQHLAQRHPQPLDPGFYGAMQEMEHKHQSTVVDADHPAVLVGQDKGRPRSSTCCTPSPPA